MSSTNFEAVEAAAVTAVHPLAEAAVICVAAMTVVGGVRIACGFLVGAVHISVPPFDTLIITERCYKSKHNFVTKLLNRQAG